MAKYSSHPVSTWTCMCGRSFRRARKCLRCGDDLPWLVYRGEISYTKRRSMTNLQYKQWREDRIEEKELLEKLIEARAEVETWLNARG